MLKYFFSKFEMKDEHLTDELMLMLVDGELSTRQAGRARKHLETCWNCRARLERIEETISLFIEFRQMVQNPAMPEPPNRWGNFKALLNRVRLEADETPAPRFSLSSFTPFQMRIGIAALTVLIISALLFQLFIAAPVSASELLDRATVRQRQMIAAEEQPVVYQKIRVRSSHSPTIDWEIWKSGSGDRFKQAVSPESGGDGAIAFGELSKMLSANGIDQRRPMAPESFRQWRATLARSSDEVTVGDVVTITTRNLAPPAAGRIAEATLKMRAEDLHPIYQTLRFEGDGRDLIYEFSEIEFSVVSLKTLKPDFFDSLKPGETVLASDNSPKEPDPSPSTTAAPLPDPSAPAEPVVADLAALEVSALQLLSGVGADLGDEISVKRESGRIVVSGLVDSEARKLEIIKALAPLADDPGFRVEIATVSEALAARSKTPAGTPSRVDNLEADSSMAAENELIEKFGSEAEARRYASRVIQISGRGMSRVYAMRRLAGQFSAAQIKEMSPETRTKFLAVIASHARAFLAENSTLSGELSRVFGGTTAGAKPLATSADELKQSVDRLFAIASTNDRLIRSALAISAGDSRFSALRSQQFWQSLGTADSIAAGIASIK